MPKGVELLAAPGDLVEANQVIAREKGAEPRTRTRRSATSSRRSRASSSRPTDGLVVRAEDVVEREYTIPHNAKLLVENGQEIRAGDAITDGPINPQEYLDTRGKDAVQRYLVKEVQKVYRSQGVTINDKHIEIIVRQMLRKVRIDQPGDVDLLPTELIDRLDFEEANNRVLAEGGEPATAQTVLLGVTKASLNTSSFLAAASFQETTRVLTEAAINGAKDHLIGLKENVIIGKLIPAGTGAPANVAARKERERRAALEALAGEAIEERAASRVQPVPRGRDGARPTTRPPASPSPRRSPATDEDEAEFNPFATTGGDGDGRRGRGRRGRARDRGRGGVQPLPRGGDRGGLSADRDHGSGPRQRGPCHARATGSSAPGRTFDTPFGPIATLRGRGLEGAPLAMGAGNPPRRALSGPRPDPPAPGGLAGSGPPPSTTTNERSSVFVPTISQLVRHGRQPKISKIKAPAHAQELEQPAPAPGADSRRPAEAGCLPAGPDDDARRSRTRRFGRSRACG